MSYKITVPLISNSAESMGLEEHLEELKRLNAERVLLSIERYYISEETKKKELEALRRSCMFFKSHGYEVGAWIWTFALREPNTYTHIKGIGGRVSEDEICPSDPEFRAFACGYLADVASCGVDLILFDDDYRYGTLPCGLGCVCDNHIAYMEKVLGEKLDRAMLPSLLLTGEGNKYRDAWQESKKYYFELFAREVREAINKVNPDIRVGLCSCLTVWDFDGTDSATLARILAGNTKPFLRLIGAPYWAEKRGWNCRLQNVIETERMERSWCGDGIEINSEGDSSPRPRTNCPANYVEIFDTALRVSGGFDGIMKYDIDYYSKPGYETGYIERHERNRPVYAAIEKHFNGKKAVGVRVYERMQKFADMLIPKEFEKSDAADNLFFSVASQMMVDNGFPTVYEGKGECGIAFAENVKAVPESAYSKGLILDMRAAQILTEKGVDVGLVSVDGRCYAGYEYFDLADDMTFANNEVYTITVNENAKVLSRFYSKKGDGTFTDKTVGSYYYENADGGKFFVFAFDAYSQFYMRDNYRRSYLRSAELKQVCDLFGAKIPAYSYGNPDLYLIAKKGANSLSVGLWNIFADEIFEPVIELDKEYKSIECIGCTGRIEGNKVHLSQMNPFSFAGFEVKE